MKKISDLFHVYNGSKLDFGKQELDPNGISFVSRDSNNNGVVGKVALYDDMKTYKKGDITVPLGGSYLLSAFVQDEDFVTAQNVAVLRPKEPMLEIEKWFYCYALRENRFKFTAFGREVNKYLRDIEVPSKIPEWAYGNTIRNIETKNKEPIPLRDTSSWQWFKVRDVFVVSTTPSLTKREFGKYPYVSRTSKNNGVSEYVEDFDYRANKVYELNDGQCITIGAEGIYAYYQSESFATGVKIYTLRNDNLNKYNALFIITLLNREDYRYNYGRARIKSRIEEEDIKLPVTDNGEVDWVYMDDYIKSLPFADIL
ncbi:MAG TPA: hypothetical protein GX705_03045 [Clostridiales bacterium]|nr:hypothetical protein [Clostridiales bacterium]